MSLSSDTKPRKSFPSLRKLFLVCIGILIIVGLLFPYAALLVPGYALSTSLRQSRSRMGWLWAIGGSITLAVVVFWFSRYFAVTISDEGPVHQVR